MAVGDRERELGELLAKIGYRPAVSPAVRLSSLPATERAWVLELYHDLGGIQESPALAPRGWDHPLVGLIVELDEEQHFTRYRARTLQPTWTRHLPWTTAYTEYSRLHESVALARNASGGFWTSVSSEAQFGASAAPRVLTGTGSSRWKQRALYDAMRDAAAACGQVNLARLSVYDRVGGRTLGNVLRQPGSGDLEAVQALIEQRMSSAGEVPAARHTPTPAPLPRDAAERATEHLSTVSSSQVLQPIPTLRELAAELQRDPKTMRAALRRRFRPHRSQRGHDWDPLRFEMIEFLRERFG